MKNNENFTTLILAAGKGTRMKSPLPKVLHPVAGFPMITRVVSSVEAAGSMDIRLVVGHGEGLVRQVVEPLGVHCYRQESQLGTADAVKAADISTLKGNVLILNGDHPLINQEDISHILKEFVNSQSVFSVVTCQLKRPGSFGRIVRHHGQLKAIVEVKDASQETLKIREVNTGIYVMKADVLQEYLPQIQNHNMQKEYYFTDMVSLCVENQESISTITCDQRVAFGVNSQEELSKATQYIFRRKNKKLLGEGVVIIDPSQTYIEDEVEIGEASVVYPGCYLRGKTRIGKFCVLEPNCYISKAHIEDSVQIRAGSYLEEASVKSKAVIGPYARLRPQTQIGEEARVGNFVEMKKVTFGNRSKANHLAYLGDAIVGEDTNIGCGAITCNYAADRNKYVTKIGDNVFVGSDTQFVAPVEVGSHATIASGSTITKDVPEGALAVARGRQIIKENYKPKAKK